MKQLVVTLFVALATPAAAFAQDSFGEAERQQRPLPQSAPQPAPRPPQQQPQQPPQKQANRTAPPTGAPAGGKLDQLMAMERQDFGIAATNKLHSGAMHGNTPASIPGGQLITTKGVVALVQNKQAPYVLLDVLGWPESLPGALMAAWASQPGSFNDGVQQQFGQMLQQVTRGNKEMPLVLYCASPQCWMSYNASLRAIALGYTNVLWYRGGIETWKSAGLQTNPSNGGG
jgi:PQQ-dependent catabolism-associated CXXCW motif protein